MMLRVQAERMNASFFPSAREYSRRYGLDARRMAALPDDAIVMHPGPMNRGIEVSSEIADGGRSLILDQVTNGVAVRMAVLYLLTAGEGAEKPPLHEEISETSREAGGVRGRTRHQKRGSRE
jgi:aspartate carbamoyltransferase catalytic subunit